MFLAKGQNRTSAAQHRQMMVLQLLLLLLPHLLLSQR